MLFNSQCNRNRTINDEVLMRDAYEEAVGQPDE